MTDASETIERLRRLLHESRRLLVFTGAGISTESGIPDFRSPGGLWQKYRPIEFADFMESVEARRETWRRRFAMGAVLDNARPNLGHSAIARLVSLGKVLTIVTQNIDGLHQAAGVPADKLVELHGSSMYATCLECGERYELSDIRVRFEKTAEPPECPCGGYVKPATISFGQLMPEREMHRAYVAASSCDLCLVAGSSLVVYPAAAIPEMAKRAGARLAIVNRDPTDLDSVADLVIREAIGKTLSAAVAGS